MYEQIYIRTYEYVCCHIVFSVFRIAAARQCARERRAFTQICAVCRSLLRLNSVHIALLCALGLCTNTAHFYDTDDPCARPCLLMALKCVRQ